VQIYYIWYGGWGNLNNNGTVSRPTTVKVLTDMAMSIGGKPWFKTSTTYHDNSGPTTAAVKYGGRVGVKSGNACWQVRRAQDILWPGSCLLLVVGFA
jgi:hypothetical protein